jgi:threonylcarbamoyladenosine tRNA methylthiotransferase MtaB
VKYSIITFGCRVNQADSLGFEEELLAGGASAAPPEQADLVIVNTCSVTASADQGARQTIRRIARTNPDAQILVTGCYATRRPDELAALSSLVRVVPNDGKPNLVRLGIRGSGLADTWEGPTTAERFGQGDGSCGAPIAPGVAGRTAFTLRVQTGCAEPCSYCIIPTTRGEPRSVPLDIVMRDVARVAAAGFKEIAITGVHLGSYGRDLTPKSSLTWLLKALSAEDVLFRISSLEPMDCTPEVVDRVAGPGNFAPHFHLPLQHASDRMLAAMRRPYTVSQYAELVDRIRLRIPHAAIGSDVIVGFPGESDRDFDQLTTYLERSPLTHVHVFPYSDRPGTEASRMGSKVPGDVVRERGRRIRMISDGLSARFRRSQLGAVHPALTIEDGSLVVTGNYLKLRIEKGLTRNEWVRVRVVSEDRGELLPGRTPLAFDDQLSTGRADIASAALAD